MHKGFQFDEIWRRGLIYKAYPFVCEKSVARYDLPKALKAEQKNAVSKVSFSLFEKSSQVTKKGRKMNRTGYF